MENKYQEFVKSVQELEESFMTHEGALRAGMVILLERHLVECTALTVALLQEEKVGPVGRLVLAEFKKSTAKFTQKYLEGCSFIPKDISNKTESDMKFFDNSVTLISNVLERMR